jgi:dihydroorotase
MPNHADTPDIDLLLKGGHVIDPAGGLSARRDVAVADGRIAAVEGDIDPARAGRVIDASAYYVTPGLIDMHVHLDPRFYFGGLVADAHSFSQGVTTMVDAGSPGSLNWQSFQDNVIATSKTRVLAFLNVVDQGMMGACEQEVGRMKPDLAAETALAHPETIVGIKCAHYWTHQPWDADHQPWDNIERGVQAGERCDLPVMVDFWPRPPERSYRDLVMNKLRPGDIHTHVFAQQFPIIIENGRLNPLMFEARQRGIIFDVGHGAGSFWFRNAVPAVKQGFVPDSISTDLHKNSIAGLPAGMLGVMSKFLNMGLTLEDVVRRSTVAPAHEIDRPELGTLDIGAEADLAVLTLDEGPCAFVDCGRARMDGSQRLEAVMTLRQGEVVYDPQGLSMPPWEGAPRAYWVVQQG